MQELRTALEEAGFVDVRTYLQSGNVVLSSESTPNHVASEVERLLADCFGLDIKVVVRTRHELAEVVKRNPLGTVATSPKLHQVTFLDGEPDAELLRKLEATAAGGEGLMHVGRELYAWHPNGVGRSKLAALLSGRALGGTARNWTTVTALLAIADE
jgi:uncharacterized protein (DUF1697 family)